MGFDDFEALAWQQWEKVPARFKQGVTGLTIERDARVHPDQADVYTLGECVTESFPSDFGSPETMSSSVLLYYGSFLRVSHQDPSFDWEGELWETLTHELQHHLEALAMEDGLLDLDYAVDQNNRRLNGADFDPLFFRAGLQFETGRYQVDIDVFIEVDAGRFPVPATFDFEWEGVTYRINRPEPTDEIRFLRLKDAPQLERGDLWLVFVPRHGVWRQLRAALQRRPPAVREGEVVAVPVTQS